MRKVLKVFCYLLGTIIVAGVAVIGTVYVLMKGSLPQLAGVVKVKGLSDQVIIERDSYGIPTISASSRIDVARALGFLHAQERYFQMDLMRRAAAGELSELFGSDAIEYDKKRRLHQFRSRSKEVINQFNPDEIAILNAYSEGVNLGINSLEVRPFEYIFLREAPAPWRPEDSLLVSYGLFFELQEEDGAPDIMRGYMKTLLPEPIYDFFVNNGTAWDSSIDGSRMPILPIPGVENFVYLKQFDEKEGSMTSSITDNVPLGGSNNWAVSGSRTIDGKGLVACDMHLRLATPNIWYRASFSYFDKNNEKISITGATLPGVPCMVIGSNQSIAWGFTNSFVDTTDIVIIKLDEADPAKYQTSSGPVSFEREWEMIHVKGKKPIPYEITKTIWGPVAKSLYFNQPYAIQWVAHRSDSINLSIMELERVKSTEEALKTIQKIKTPLLNFVVADSQGHIGWGLIGAIPKRQGFDGTTPVSYTEGDKKWTGLIIGDEFPSIMDPQSGYLWTANNRVIGKKSASWVNEEGYLNGIRAYQIGNRLKALPKATPKDMLDLQMDTEGLFFKRWQHLLIGILEKANSSSSDLVKLKALVKEWNNHSSHDSSAYYWIRRFRENVLQHILARFLSPCINACKNFTCMTRDFEEPVWVLVSQKPEYLINPKYGSWDDELLAYAQDMLDTDLEETKEVDELTWGGKTLLFMHHPFSRSISILQPYLDMPQECLSGDIYMPKVAGPHSGASQRMVVSPGNEYAGVFHAPGGQSGHPLSPNYSDGHEAWVKGHPSSFLPGETVNTLVLVPKG